MWQLEFEPENSKNRSAISDSADALLARVGGWVKVDGTGANCLFQGNLCLNYSNKYTVSAKKKKTSFGGWGTEGKPHKMFRLLGVIIVNRI